MKNYKNYINENLEPIQPGDKGKLSIEVDDSDYSEDWKLTLTLEKTWKQYSEKSITLLDFNNIYATTLIENQQQISSACGDAAWISIEPIVVDELRQATSVEDSEKVYDKLYDVFDKYEIFINTGNYNTGDLLENNDTEVSTNQDEPNDYIVGDIIRVDLDGNEVSAQISKITAKNTFLIKIEQDGVILPKEYNIYKSQIRGIISGVDSPANKSDWNQDLKQQSSNDLAINGAGTPGVPAPGKGFN